MCRTSLYHQLSILNCIFLSTNRFFRFKTFYSGKIYLSYLEIRDCLYNTFYITCNHVGLAIPNAFHLYRTGSFRWCHNTLSWTLKFLFSFDWGISVSFWWLKWDVLGLLNCNHKLKPIQYVKKLHSKYIIMISNLQLIRLTKLVTSSMPDVKTLVNLSLL